MIPSKNILQETLNLEKRSRRLLRSGWNLLLAGAVLTAVSASSWLAGIDLAPDAVSFSPDIPDSINALADEIRQDGGIAQATSFMFYLIEAGAKLIFPVAMAAAVAKGALIAIGGLCRQLERKAKAPRTVTITVFIALSLAVVPVTTRTTWNVTKEGLKSYEKKSFLSKLETIPVTPERKTNWDYQYVSAQSALLSSHADRSQLQAVLKEHEARDLNYKIPTPVRYALEIQAFDRPLSEDTRGFRAVQEDKAARYHRISLYALAGAVLLAITALLARFTGTLIYRRVSFLKAIR